MNTKSEWMFAKSSPKGWLKWGEWDDDAKIELDWIFDENYPQCEFDLDLDALNRDMC